MARKKAPQANPFARPAPAGNSDALVAAGARGDVAQIRTLVADGAPVDSQDGAFRTALHHAAIYRHAAAVGVLLQLKANPNLQDHQGRTPLNYVCKEGARDIVESLLQHGADPNVRDAWGVTPLYSAVYWTCDDKIAPADAFSFLELLIAAGGDSDIPNERGTLCSDIAWPHVVPSLERARGGRDGTRRG